MAISERLMLAAHEIGIKLEMVDGIPVWEASPVILHQKATDRIRASIYSTGTGNNPCGCFHYPDINIRFPDGSDKRPDISIYCQEPEEEDKAVTAIPDAVIEIISRGYEKKDKQISMPFYIAQNIRDAVLFDPYTGEVMHYVNGVASEYTSPVALTFQCGCACLV